MKRTFLMLVLSLAAKVVVAQTNLITPVTVLPKSDRSAVGELRFRDKQATPHYVGFKSSSTVGSNLIWTLPSADALGCLMSDGVLGLSFGTCAPADMMTTDTAQTVTGVKTFAANILFDTGNARSIGTKAVPGAEAYFRTAIGTDKLQIYDPTDPSAGGMSGPFWYQYASYVSGYEWGLVDNSGNPALEVHRGTILGADKYLWSDGDVISSTDNTYSLGRSGNIWSKVWAQDGDLAGNLTVHGTCTGCGSFVMPGSDTQILYNKSGTPFADSNLVWDYTGQNLNLSGNLHFGSHNVYDIGTTTTAAHYGYFQSAVGTVKLQIYDFSAGDLTGPFWNVQANATIFNSGLGFFDNAGAPVLSIHRVSTSAVDKRFEADGDFNAMTTNTWSLGNSSVRWKKVWAGDADFSGNALVSGQLTIGSSLILPSGGCSGCLPVSAPSAILTSGGFAGSFDTSLTAARTWTFPDIGGHIAIADYAGNSWTFQTFGQGVQAGSSVSTSGVIATNNSAFNAAMDVTNNNGSYYGIYDHSTGGSFFSGTVQMGALSVGNTANITNAVTAGSLVDNGTATVAGDFSVNTKFTVDHATGEVSKYGNVLTSGMGVPPIVSAVFGSSITSNQSINFTVGGGNPVAGVYRVSLTMGCSATTGGVPDASPTLGWHDGGASSQSGNSFQRTDAQGGSVVCGVPGSTPPQGEASFIPMVIYTDGTAPVTLIITLAGSGASFYYYAVLERLK